MDWFSWPLIVLILLLVALGIVWYTLWKTKKESKKITQNVPANILKMFDEAERRIKKYGTKISPQQIIWDLRSEFTDTTANPKTE